MASKKGICCTLIFLIVSFLVVLISCIMYFSDDNDHSYDIVLILLISFGAIALLIAFLSLIILVGLCCASDNRVGINNHPSTYGTSYQRVPNHRTSYQRVPNHPQFVSSMGKRPSASDYSAAKAHAPSSVSSITTNVTVSEAISRVRPDNVEVDLSEFSRFIPAVDTEECRNTRKLCDMAESGDAEAIYLFGLCFKKGFAVRRDYTRAALLFLIAAEKGNDDAVCELGIAFEDGHGVDKDYSKAVTLYQAAALEGCTDAMVRLGLCYLNGTGIEEDHVKAIQLWIIAAAAGNEMAMEILKFIRDALES